ncbi:MAG: elongation factor G [Candidatus Brocadiia bacterium]
MADHQTADLRTFAIAGHGSVGKTVLAEAVLVATGLSGRLGDPAQATSVVDFHEEEKERQFTIFSTLLHARHKGKLLQLIDTPGYDDFFGEVVGACAAVETVLVAVAADAGIQVNTRRVWKHAGEAGLGRAIVVTRMDAENADFGKVLAALQESFGNACVPLTIPVGSGPDFSAVVGTLSPPDDVPPEVADRVREVGADLRDSIVESDDALMERYLEGEEVGPQELMAAATGAVAQGTLVPVFCVASQKDLLGVREMLDAIVALFPSPDQGLVRRGTRPDAEDEEVERPARPDAPFSAQVFKTLYDPYVGKLAYFRIFSGTLSPADGLYTPRTGKREKLAHIYRVQGEKQEEIEEAVAGDLVAVAKIESLEISDTLCDERDPVVFPPLRFPEPMVSRAAEPKTRGDEERLSTALTRIASQDKTFKEGRDPQTGELVITGMSDLHLNVTMSRLARKPYEVEMTLKEPRIPYKETISAPADGHYRHKKQTGGRGQFAEVFLRVEPMERGEDFEFVDEIHGGSIPRQFLPAVEKGVRETMGQGVIAGYPVVGIRAAATDGKHHEVDSSEAAFKIAAARAFSDAFRNAKPILLEPIVNMEITVPSKYMGDISGDLSSRRGRIQGMHAEGDQQIITAQVPLAEVANYSTQLRSVTGGEGSYTMEFSHYEPVPSSIQQEIVQKAATKQGDDEG